ncbi:MAG: hypothetical protein ACOY90_19410 [Candidatus Zhuqueibacterota bacterium]
MSHFKPLKIVSFHFAVCLMLYFGCGGSQKGLVETSDTSTKPDRLSVIRQQVKENPQDANAYLNLSTAYADLDSVDNALGTIDTALSIDPDFAKARLVRAELLLKKNKIKDSYNEYLEILKGDQGEDYVAEIRAKLGQPYPIHQLTRGDHNNAFPSFSPDNKKIIFQSDRTGNWQLYLIDADGAQEIRLTTNAHQDEMPVYGSSDNIIAFTSTRDDTVHKDRLSKNRNIYLMDMNTGSVARAVENDADDWYPALIGKGEQIVFVSEVDDHRDVQFHEKLSDIYFKDFASGTTLRLTQNEADDGSPAVAANDKWIAFTSNVSGVYQVYRMNTKGGLVEQLTYMNGNCGAPHFSPDGKKIVFFSENGDGYNLYMMNNTGRNLEQLTSDSSQDSYPSFSSDKRKVLFHSNRSGKFQLYWIDLMSPLTHDDLVRELEQKIASAN